METLLCLGSKANIHTYIGSYSYRTPACDAMGVGPWTLATPLVSHFFFGANDLYKLFCPSVVSAFFLLGGAIILIVADEKYVCIYSIYV